MDAATAFISSIADLLGVFVWPTVAALGLYVLVSNFKNEIKNLINRISRISRNGTTIDFGLVENLDLDGPESVEIDDRTTDVIEHYPRAAIIEAWLRFEWTSRTILEERGHADRRMTLRGTVQALLDRDLIDLPTRAVLFELIKIRNEAAHDLSVDIAPEQARRYVEYLEYTSSMLGTAATGTRH